MGCGPGDPDLLTVKAVNAIRTADVILCPKSKDDRPSIALSVVSSLVDRSKTRIVEMVFPMTKDKDVLEQTWEHNAEVMAKETLSCKNAVYITVGDPYLYSTWIYMNRILEEKHPEISITVVPGIVSMFTFASKIGVSIGEGAEKISVIPSCYDLGQVKKLAKNSDTMVFLKDGRYFDKVIDLLREAKFPPTSIFAVGQDLDTENEVVKKLTLGEVNDDTLTTKYFSIMVVKRA
ncbi:MAG: Precorrin-2 C20-methyltransferase [Cenarchaeum symbiont of Oopsacas minuta]|nr:Precorrin-2 C20-methyltransferase [Cenarchaeum symbiont of Oopsacas minuta]